MEERIRKKQYTRSISYKYFIYMVAVIAIMQLLTLRACYTEKVYELPERLFSSAVDFPIDELTLDTTSSDAEPEITGDGETAVTEEIPEAEAEESETDATGIQNLTDTQKNIVLKALEMFDRDIEYNYQLYPDTGYPNSNVWISTDVISVTYNECGIDLMELINKDIAEHTEYYSSDENGGKIPTLIKYIDFRNVIFQEVFFSKYALATLPLEYDLDDENRDFLWQPGDIVYFRFDENNIDKDRGGFISPYLNSNGVPKVIMISPETNTLEEADVLQEYEIVGHYRYPPPVVD
jgi:uncharacterized protein YijF (DUF1287 family)